MQSVTSKPKQNKLVKVFLIVLGVIVAVILIRLVWMLANCCIEPDYSQYNIQVEK